MTSDDGDDELEEDEEDDVVVELPPAEELVLEVVGVVDDVVDVDDLGRDRK